MSAAPLRILGDKYRLIRPLDTGGMGSVWLAEHLSLASPVAVKLITAEVAKTADRLQRFLREARAAAASRSPHVVQILDYGVDEGTPYIVMELLEGESLAERLARRGRLGARETEAVIRHVSRALNRAHEAGVVHRDLKPANVFITHDEEEEIIKLFDFGVAKAALEGQGAGFSKATRTGSFLGTPYYMSPEQLEGSRRCDHRTDIWAMGVIAFECLVGRVPFVGQGIGGLVLAICSHPLPVPSEQAEVPAGFDQWFARACCRELGQRFPSAREAARELRRLIDPSADAEARPPAPSAPEGDAWSAVNAEPASARRAAAAALVSAEPVSARRAAAATVVVGTAGARRALRLPAAVALPSTTADPSSATLDRGQVRRRAAPLLMFAPIALCLLVVAALHGFRRAPAEPEAVVQALAPAPAVQPGGEPAGLILLGRADGDQRASIDGRDAGPLPREVHGLDPGEHTVTITGGARYRAHHARVTLAPGSVTSLGPIELEVARGLATIVPGPDSEGAEVTLTIAGAARRLPPLPVQLDVETDEPHVLSAQKAGFARFEQLLRFEDGQAEKAFSVALAPLPKRQTAAQLSRHKSSSRRGRGRTAPSARAEREATARAPSTLTFTSTPDAAVLLDGAPLGTTPLRDVPVAPGPHRVIFIHGPQRKAMQVVGVPGKKRVVSASFR